MATGGQRQQDSPPLARHESDTGRGLSLNKDSRLSLPLMKLLYFLSVIQHDVKKRQLFIRSRVKIFAGEIVNFNL